MGLGKVPLGWWSRDMSLGQSMQVYMPTMEILNTPILTVTSKREGGEGANAHYRHKWHSRQTTQLASETCKPCKNLYSVRDPTEHGHPQANIGSTQTLPKLHLATCNSPKSNKTTITIGHHPLTGREKKFNLSKLVCLLCRN